jgi:hypothetical protein
VRSESCIGTVCCTAFQNPAPNLVALGQFEEWLDCRSPASPQTGQQQQYWQRGSGCHAACSDHAQHDAQRAVHAGDDCAQQHYTTEGSSGEAGSARHIQLQGSLYDAETSRLLEWNFNMCPALASETAINCQFTAQGWGHN